MIDNRCSKYDYIIYTNTQDYWNYMLQDIDSLDNVQIIGNPLEYFSVPRFLRVINKYHYHGYMNYFFDLPGKGIWNRCYFKDIKSTGRTKCFVFMMTWVKKEYEPFFKFLKSHYPTCKFILYLEDTISSRTTKSFAKELVDRYFDSVISYDESEAKEFKYHYYPTFISRYQLNRFDNSKNNKDVFFCGAAKNRFMSILSTYNALKEHHLTCDFVIARFSHGDCSIEKEDFLLIDKLWSYQTYLEHLSRCSCIVEIVQPHCVGYTLRTWEALLHNKKLLTNNKAILSSPFYDSSRFQYFESPDMIDYEFFKSEIAPIDEKQLERLSPIYFLKFIETILK